MFKVFVFIASCVVGLSSQVQAASIEQLLIEMEMKNYAKIKADTLRDIHPNTPADVGELPADFRALVEAGLKVTLIDPYSAVITVGDAIVSSCEISNRTLTLEAVRVNIRDPRNAGYFEIYGTRHGWRVPVQYNAKNRMGGYVGVRTEYGWIVGGQVDRFFSNRIDLCSR